MSTAMLNGTFVPADLDCSDFANIEPYFTQLQEREIPTADELEQWLKDYSDLVAVVGEYGSRANINLACHTEDAEIEKVFMNFVENVQPKLQPLGFKLQQKYLALPFAEELNDRDTKFHMLHREWKTDVEIYRDENIALFTELTKLNTEYGKVRGAMIVNFRGEDMTLQQLGRFQEETDRATREEAWRLGEQRQAQDVAKEEEIFSKMIELRTQVASNADEPDFRSYTWKQKGRFDYTPEDCLEFGNSIAKLFVPLVDELNRQRKESLGLDVLRPWDTAVDVKGRDPLRPFDAKQISTFVDGTKEIIGKVSPGFADEFETLRENNNLDLESRKAKRPGGFQATLMASRQPFIFMNAAGVQRDVDTLLHEAGHAFHTLWARDEPIIFVTHAPMEFCEVASMSMELLACDDYGIFYDTQEEAARAKRKQLEGIIRFFPWMATIDGFQHWLYTNPGHSESQRAEAWLNIWNRFRSKEVDYTGFEDITRTFWHRQLHLFGYPFYYVEYGIAQLGALQVWRNSLQNKADAVAKYRQALSLGGTRPLPDLFEAAGAKFDFSPKTIEPLVELCQSELAKLPD